MPIGKYTCRVQWRIVLNKVLGPQDTENLKVDPAAKICNCLPVIHYWAAPIGNFASYGIILVICSLNSVLNINKNQQPYCLAMLDARRTETTMTSPSTASILPS